MQPVKYKRDIQCVLTMLKKSEKYLNIGNWLSNPHPRNVPASEQVRLWYLKNIWLDEILEPWKCQKCYPTSSAILNDAIWLKMDAENHWWPNNLPRKLVLISHSQHCAFWWLSTIKWVLGHQRPVMSKFMSCTSMQCLKLMVAQLPLVTKIGLDHLNLKLGK